MRPSAYISDPNLKPNWRVLFDLLPYFGEFKIRVAIAIALLIGAKLANVALPWVLKLVVDDLDLQGATAIAVPIGLLIAYGSVRFASVFLGEMRDAVFARVTERAMRRVGLKVFSHLHRLDLDFHLSRKTGGLSRDIERGTSGISFLMRFMVFNIVPTLFEIALVALILFAQFSVWYLLGVLVSVIAYIGFSVVVTEWRTKFVRAANEQDNKSNTRAIDSLLNYETVKYFNNEHYEVRQYDENLAAWEQSRLKNRLTLAVLNSGQALIIAVAVTSMMIFAAYGVANGQMTLGDFVMVNAYMIQLFIPLNFLGFVYREIRQALINIENMFALLKIKPKVEDAQDAKPLSLDVANDTKASPAVVFDRVSFSYDGKRQILNNISFTIEPGKKVAVVGASGAGKSTLAKLLFRFYDPTGGEIRIGEHNIARCTQESVRALMGVVPQDTVLFNDTIYYNIAYGDPSRSRAQVEQAAKQAHLWPFIEQLPKGLDTLVGERGLKVSGGEKQRIAIARVLLKGVPILIFDEATSALDTHTESVITQTLNEAAEDHAAFIIAHRLSTVMNADMILVLDQGRIVEQGTHEFLLQSQGYYANLWESQRNVTENSE